MGAGPKSGDQELKRRPRRWISMWEGEEAGRRRATPGPVGTFEAPAILKEQAHRGARKAM